MGRPHGTKNIMRTPEEKEKLLKEFYESGLGVIPFTQEHGVNKRLFQRWQEKYEKFGFRGLVSQTGKTKGKKKGRKKKNLTELEKLELENLNLKIDLERAKKGYIVKGDGSKKEYISLKIKNTK